LCALKLNPSFLRRSKDGSEPALNAAAGLAVDLSEGNLVDRSIPARNNSMRTELSIFTHILI
jgi:hypothetical protein